MNAGYFQKAWKCQGPYMEKFCRTSKQFRESNIGYTGCIEGSSETTFYLKFVRIRDLSVPTEQPILKFLFSNDHRKEEKVQF